MPASRRKPRWTCPICEVSEAIKGDCCALCKRWLDYWQARPYKDLLRYQGVADRLIHRQEKLSELHNSIESVRRVYA